MAAIVAEQLHNLLELLPDEELKQIAIARMEGQTNKEIAGRLGCKLRTIERRVAYIRVIWKEEAELPDAFQ